MTHSLFAPSAAHRWINCPGSITFPENQEAGPSSTFADDGTASHAWAAQLLKDAWVVPAPVIELNGNAYYLDEERVDFINIYLEDVQRRAIGGTLFVEHWVDLSHLLGEDQGGTCDAGIIVGDQIIVEDLKYGTGEKVYASYDGKINPQLGLYLLGLLKDAQLLGHEIKTATGVICQPRLGHIDEFTVSIDELKDFGVSAAISVTNSKMRFPHFNPSDSTCRWCRAKSKCPALAAFVAKEVALDFEDVTPTRQFVKYDEGLGQSVFDQWVCKSKQPDLAKAYRAVPLVTQWCKAVEAEVAKQVTEGKEVIGPDGKPYKFVQGDEGKRQWTDEAAAEAALVGQLADKAYAPKKIITAPVAAKILDKKATKALWADVFSPLIKRARGRAMLVQGSDPRPAYNNVATADDFAEDLSE
jgi:Protein of unknown function (DUF2800)